MPKTQPDANRKDSSRAARQEAVKRAARALEREVSSGRKSSSDEGDEDYRSSSSGEPDSKLPASPIVTPPIAGIASPLHRQTSGSSLKKGVPHIYHDYSQFADHPIQVRKKTGGVTTPFPEKLHEMLDGEIGSDVVSWLPHGRAFIVRKPKEFTQIVMPK